MKEQGRVRIREETPEDRKAIFDVNVQAFGRQDEALLIEALRCSIESSGQKYPFISLVAELDGQVVGHILFTQIHVEDGSLSTPVLGLAPLAVFPEYQKRGIGSQLVRSGLAWCSGTEYPAVVVLGHPDYYPRFDFLPAVRFGIRASFPGAEEALMVYELKPRALAGIKGTVIYPQEFEGI